MPAPRPLACAICGARSTPETPVTLYKMINAITGEPSSSMPLCAPCYADLSPDSSDSPGDVGFHLNSEHHHG